MTKQSSKGNHSRGRNTQAGSSNSAVPRMVPISRWFEQLIPTTGVLLEATNPSESQLGVGSNYVHLGLDYSVRNFVVGSSGLYTTVDQYRFEEIQVFAFLDATDTSGGTMLVVSSVDYDDAVAPTSWDSMSQRSNTKTVSLNRTAPYKCIGKFKPRGNFVTGGTDSPSNAVASPNTWWDMANPNQLFNALKVSVASSSLRSVRFLAKAKINFRGKI